MGNFFNNAFLCPFTLKHFQLHADSTSEKVFSQLTEFGRSSYHALTMPVELMKTDRTKWGSSVDNGDSGRLVVR